MPLCFSASAVIATLATPWAQPALAQGLSWFYCYAPNPSTGTVLVSDAQPIGPVSERGGYGREFSTYLTSRGKLPAGTQVYCVMRASEQEVRRGQQELAERCDECGGARQFERVVWPRGGKTVRQVLAGEGTPRSSTPAPAPQQPAATVEKVAAEGIGVFMMVRTDQTEITHTANEDNGRFLTRFKADQRGGAWTWVLQNDRCQGWLAVAYATNGSERKYFIARGSADEGAASRAALAAAETFAKGRNLGWITGVISAFRNNYVQPGPDFSRGAIQVVKEEVRRQLIGECGDSVLSEGVAFGVRG